MRQEVARSCSLGQMRQRAAWVFAISALALTLALGGCRAGGARNSAGGQTIQQNQNGGSSASNGGAATSTTGASTSSSTGATGSSNSAALQQLQSIDSQNQSDSSQLNSAQNDANVNYASQENQTQP